MNEQLHFLNEQYLEIIKKADPLQPARWGKMNFQQMVEHVSAFFKVSTKKLIFPLVSAPEHMPRIKEFLMSDKQFRENTKAPAAILGEEPLPPHHKTPAEAIEKLEKEVNYFFEFYAASKEATAVHPVFGELNFDEWVRLHYKHVTHHLRQFGLYE